MEKNMNGISVKEHGHVFTLSVAKDGDVECCIDNGEAFAVKKIKRGNVYFAKKQKITVNDKPLTIGGLVLNESDFAVLKEAQDAVLVNEREKQESAKPVKAQVAQSVQPFAAVPKEVLKRVDSWKRKICTCNKNGTKQEYCVHKFRIGDNKYQFVERNIPGVGVIVNPDYKISEDVPFVGGLAKQHGELMFWEYLYQDKGWERVRTLTNNEMICLDIINKYGFYADRHAEA